MPLSMYVIYVLWHVFPANWIRAVAFGSTMFEKYGIMDNIEGRRNKNAWCVPVNFHPKETELRQDHFTSYEM